MRGVSVLVTRPAHQAGDLVARIEALGGYTIELPTIEIDPIIISKRERGCISEATHCIFVSANAVTHGLDQVGVPALEGKQIFAVGLSTQRVLLEAGIRNVRSPEGQSSEALLRDWPLEGAGKHRVVIFRGRGGRERLKEGLTELGADVSYIEVYLRRPPQGVHADHLHRALDQRRSSLCITTTSVEGLSNLMVLAGSRSPDLVKCPLVVIGQRQLEVAQKMGWTGKIVPAEPGNQSIADAVVGLNLA